MLNFNLAYKIAFHLRFSFLRFAQYYLEINKLGVKPLRRNVLGKIHNDKSIAYILGCGDSINQITSEQYLQMSKNLSIGVNQFFRNERFVPDYLCLEGARKSEIENLKKNKYNPQNPWLKIQERYASIKPPKLILKDLHQLKFDTNYFPIKSWQPESYSIFTTPLAVRDKSDLRSSIRQHWKLSRFLGFQWIFGIRGSLAFLIWLLAKEGFRNIVILGIDLEGLYFFEDRNSFENDEKPLHPTMVSDDKDLDIVSFLNVFSSFATDELGVQIWKSACSEAILLPEYDWSNQLST